MTTMTSVGKKCLDLKKNKCSGTITLEIQYINFIYEFNQMCPFLGARSNFGPPGHMANFGDIRKNSSQFI